MQIRLAKLEDLEHITKIERICFPVAEAATAADFQKRFDAFGECFLVADNGNEVIGFVNGCVTDKPILSDELYYNPKLHISSGGYQTVFGLDVLPEYRGQGVAAQLLNEFIELAKQRNQKGMILTCKDHLIHYYEKFGFVHQGISDSSHGGAVWHDMLMEFHVCQSL